MNRAFIYFEFAVLVAALLTCLGDLFFFAFGGAGQTISFSIWKWSKAYPVIPYLLGFLTGHLLWQYDPTLVQESLTKNETDSNPRQN